MRKWGWIAMIVSAWTMAVGIGATEPSFYVLEAASHKEAASAQSLVSEAQRTLQSDRFRENLLSLSTEYTQIFAGTTEKGNPEASVLIDVPKLAEIISGTPPYRYAYSPVKPRGSWHHYVPTDVQMVDGEIGELRLARGHLWNWQNPSHVTRSCAINTVAHEMTHLISNDVNAMNDWTQPLRDWGAGNLDPKPHVASYLAGAVAQCTWLQESGYSPSVDLRKCVKVFGSRAFNSGRCSQFPNGTAVEFRDGLYEEAALQPN